MYFRTFALERGRLQLSETFLLKKVLTLTPIRSPSPLACASKYMSEKVRVSVATVGNVRFQSQISPRLS